MNAPAPLTAPPPALVVISGGPQPHAGTPASAPAADPAFARLFKALPAATRVLELGCGAGELAMAYLTRHPGCHWTGADRRPELLAQAASRLHQVISLTAGADALTAVQGPFDLIVINRLEHLADAPRLLADLACLLAPAGTLMVRAENQARLSVMARLVEADLSTGIAARPGDAASLDEAHPRFQSHSTIYKMLLDAGWTPTLVDHEPDEPQDDRLAAAARYMGETLGVPAGCADRVWRMKHLIIRAQRTFADDIADSGPARFDVVVPTNNEQQLRVNVEQSPGLAEVGARIVSYRHASSPAEALSESLRHVRSDWVLMCHQDAYLPKGFGHRLNAVLAAIPPQERARTLIGFVGIGIDLETRTPCPAGFVVDRLNVADHPASDAVLSIDEVAIVVARDAIHRIDPLIGWHLWATEMCLSAICEHEVFPRIVRLPLYHNSQTGWRLPEGFFDSAEYLRQKFPQFDTIHTLCGDIDEGFVARQRKAQS